MIFAAPKNILMSETVGQKVQWPCKGRKLDQKLQTQDDTGVTNEQYHSKELIQGFSGMFFFLRHCSDH